MICAFRRLFSSYRSREFHTSNEIVFRQLEYRSVRRMSRQALGSIQVVAPLCDAIVFHNKVSAEENAMWYVAVYGRKYEYLFYGLQSKRAEQRHFWSSKSNIHHEREGVPAK